MRSSAFIVPPPAECIAAALHHAHLVERLRISRAHWENAEVRVQSAEARVEGAQRRICAINEHLLVSRWIVARIRK
jgi:hypothetical protein